MAKIENGILGTVTGSIAFITARKSQGRNTLSLKANRTHVIYTAAQLDQQARFKRIVDFIHANRDIFGEVPYISDDYRLHDFNYAMKLLKPSFSSIGIIDVESLYFSQGSFTSAQFAMGLLTLGTGFLEVYYNPALIAPDCSADDFAFVWLVDLSTGQYKFFDTNAIRGNGVFYETVFAGYSFFSDLYCFMSWVKASDTSVYSTSIYTHVDVE